MVHTLKRIFDFYIFANIHVGLAAFSLTKITLLSYDINENTLPAFVFLGTIIGYNFIRIYSVSEIQHWFFHFIKKYKPHILALTIISASIDIYLVFQLKLEAVLVLLPLGLCTLFYAIPIKVNENSSFSLRGIAMLKLFLIAFTWAGVTVLVPLVNYGIPIHSGEWITFLQRFLFIVVITVPFDIRDLKYDNKNLKTLPQVVGIQKVKIIGLFFLMIFLGLEFFKHPINPEQFRNNLLIAVLSLLLLVKATENQHKYYSAFLVESVPILWLLLILIP